MLKYCKQQPEFKPVIHCCSNCLQVVSNVNVNRKKQGQAIFDDEIESGIDDDVRIGKSTFVLSK